jgi:hypothetical protein
MINFRYLTPAKSLGNTATLNNDDNPLVCLDSGEAVQATQLYAVSLVLRCFGARADHLAGMEYLKHVQRVNKLAHVLKKLQKSLVSRALTKQRSFY